MNELNEEIKLTINTMQRDIDDAAHGELQYHLHSLLEIKRNELQQRLVERSRAEPAKPLTSEELKAGGWWCADVSEECRLAFVSMGVSVAMMSWENSPANANYAYKLFDSRDVILAFLAIDLRNLKQIHRIGNDFYWCKP